MHDMNHQGEMVISTSQFHSTKPEIWFCTGSNPTCGIPEICNDEDLNGTGWK